MVNPFVKYLLQSVLSYCREMTSPMTPDGGLDLERGSQILMHDTSSHYAFFFCEVSFNLFP